MVESTEQGLQKLAELQSYVLEKKKEKKQRVLEDEQLELHFKSQENVN